MDLSHDPPEQSSLRTAAQRLLNHGVKEWVFIHFPRGVFALSTWGEEIVQGAVKLPRGDVVSTVGAGDAFAAGTLWGIHEDWDMQRSIRLGVCAAAACLLEVGCSDGIKSQQECVALGALHSFHELYHDKIQQEVE
jgi:sugar/nucleoside kinase (ribokinase family)